MQSLDRPPSLKRKRLTHACNACRSRKVKCDELLPSCGNCSRAGINCITIDPRNGTLAQRTEAPTVTASPAGSNHTATKTSPEAQDLADASSPVLASSLTPLLPRFVHANSLSVLTQWLNLAFARLGVDQRVSGLSSSVNMLTHNSSRLFPLLEAHELLTQLAESGGLFSHYSTGVHRILPLVDDLPRVYELLHGAESEAKAVAMIICALVVAVASCSDNSPQSCVMGERLFHYAYSRLPEIIDTGHLQNAVSALALMALYLRWHNDVRKAWHIHSLAAAMAQSQGLNRKSHQSSGDGGASRASSNLFWSLYIIDKVLAIELERRPLLPRADADQILPPAADDDSMFQAIIALAKIQDTLLERLEQQRVAEESATTAVALNRLVQNKMRAVGELDDTLQRFVESLPQDLKPSEYLYSEPDNLTGSSFLGCQYHQTIFLLHRNSMILNTNSIRSQVDELFAGKTYRNRLKNGPTVCIQSARSLLNILSHSGEMGVHSVLTSPYAPLLAMYALTIYAIRKLSPATAKSDLALQATAIELIEQSQNPQSIDQPTTGLVVLLKRLHEFTASYVNGTLPLSNQLPSTVPTVSFSSNDYPRNILAPTQNVMSPPQSPANTLTNPQNRPNTAAVPPTYQQEHIPSWPPLDENLDELFQTGDLSHVDIDWDALALEFDLPHS
jgi:hypothetical protein